jgi:hypothetical protein
MRNLSQGDTWIVQMGFLMGNSVREDIQMSLNLLKITQGN